MNVKLGVKEKMIAELQEEIGRLQEENRELVGIIRLADERFVADRRARAMEGLLRPPNPVARELAPPPPLSRAEEEDSEGALVIDV